MKYRDSPIVMSHQEPEKKNKTIYTSFVDTMEGEIYEEIVDADFGLPGFLQYDKSEEAVGEVIDEVTIEGATYKPIDSDIVKKRIIYLPSEAREYGTTEQILHNIQQFIHTYVDLTEFGEKLTSYYVLLSWVYDSFETIPYLRFVGDYGTGKSRALKVIGSLCYKPIFGGGSITPSPIFRLIEQFKGTLIIDEADFSRSDHFSEITKILNCGFTRDMPVLRTEGDKNKQAKAFDVFSPKILATREFFKDLALESRCINEIMKGNPRPDIPFQLPKNFHHLALQLRNMLLMFRFRNYLGVDVDEQLRIPAVEPRINQIAMPILALIEDEAEREKIKQFIVEYDKSLKHRRSDEIPALILTGIITAHQEDQKLTYKNIANHINKDRDEKTGEYKISPARIGKLNSTVLGFESRRVNGRTEVFWNENKAKELCLRYGVDFEESMTVKTDEENLNEEFPDKPK